ncbi:hypothetical protein K450DRAFT_256549 [Umbelopsis ramanniana AG]|uniref:HECT-type E3 ubiquitin transferase n=1 Tax=Umbelopsis ramanniana AG TaxID=1314678 RepID=A0AAD5E341_UMBRA|nr:uncharacterized protein K450DRAFT_256549 [Umbelopsis ramanniana AG]KAI8576516.1 hypothetical protein K450DRAFT_256549 [Umbelopsis ramanniana AG]
MDRSRSSNSQKVKRTTLASSPHKPSLSDTDTAATTSPCHSSKDLRKQPSTSSSSNLISDQSTSASNSTRKRNRTTNSNSSRKLPRTELTARKRQLSPKKKANQKGKDAVQSTVMSGNKRGHRQTSKKYMSSNDDDILLDVKTKGKAKASSSSNGTGKNIERRVGRAGSRAAKKQADPKTLDATDEQEESNNDAISRFTSLFSHADSDTVQHALEDENYSEDEDGDVHMHTFDDAVEEEYDDDDDDPEEEDEHVEDDEEDDDDEEEDEEDTKDEFDFTGAEGDMPADMRRFFASMRLAELLSVSTEDTLAGIFNSEPYVKELVHILKGSESMIGHDDIDDATLAAIMASGGDFGAGNPEMMLLACRCISNLIEAMPSAMGTVVYSGAVPVLCQKLKEIQYIDLAEQALSTLEKISAEFPNAVVREGGLSASLMYIDFFNTHVQRTALTIAANCCRNISSDAFAQVQDIVPILTNTITYSDQRVVEQSCLCWLRLAKSFKNQRESLEAIVSEDLLKTMVGFIAGSGSSNSIGPQVFSSLMQFLSIVAKSSPTLRIKLLSENIIDILFHILTGGVAPPTEDLQSTIVVSSIAPKSNNAIFEILDILVGLLPDLPTDGIFSTKPQALLKPDGTPVEAPIASRTRSSHSRTNSDEVTVDESTALWRERPHIAERICQIMVPTMFEVYSSTVNLQIRQVVMTMLLKIIYFSDTQVLERVLITIPLAGFIAGVLAQKEHSSLVVTALQLADLLLTKLPSLYTSHFETEGVIFEIRRLASSCDDKQASSEETKASSSSTSSEKPPTTAEEEVQDSSQASAADKLESELQAIFGDRELDVSFTSGMRLFDRLKKSSTSGNKSQGDTQEWLSVTAQNFLILYSNTTKISEASHTEGTDHLKHVAECLQGRSQDMTPKAALQEIAARYRSGSGISSFELMNTGLIDGLLSYVTTTGTEDAELNYRHHMFMHVFMGGPDPDSKDHDLHATTTEETTNVFHVLVSKLQDSLNRLESFEVVTPYQGPVDDMRRNPTGMLAKQLRLKLTGDGSDIPRAYQNLIVSVHAVATFKAIDEYLRPRISRTSLESRDKLRAGISRRQRKNKEADATESTTSQASEKPEEASDAASKDVAADEKQVPANDSVESSDDVTAGEIGTDTPVSERTVEMEITDEGVATKEDRSATSSVASEKRSKPESYSAALSMSSKDWHIEFAIDDIPITVDTTIYGAIHQYEKRLGNSRNVWTATYPITYKKIAGESPAKDTKPEVNETNVSPFVVSDMPSGQDECSKILHLLRALDSINARWPELYNGDADIRRSKSSIKTLFKHDFHNRKLTAKLNRQLDEPLIVASSCLPEWCYDLAKGFPFLFPFETRYLFLQSTSFGYSRSMNRWMNQQARGGSLDTRRDENQPFLGRIDRQKVRISRSRMLESAVKVLELYGKSQSVLEVEYFDEEGTGLGPTLEFYAIISKQFCKKSIHMWRDDDDKDGSQYVGAKLGLFPRPMSATVANSDKGRKIINLFKVLGQFVSKAMLDSRNIDIPFNPIFLAKILDPAYATDITTIMEIDAPLANSLLQLQSFVNQKHAVYATGQAPYDTALASIQVQGATLDDLCLDFTLPGDSDMELKANGSQIPVTIHNVDEYLGLVMEAVTGSGIARQVEAFRSGFDGVFPVNDLRLFSPDELASLFGKTVEDWSYTTLVDAIKADHGYNMESKSIKSLVEIMTEFTMEERREFLQFITGSPKLPIGGWKNLNPMFTIVRKPHEPPLTSDDYLPSVMTCVNYLKLPDYSGKDTMRQRLLTSITEGKGSFLLS